MNQSTPQILLRGDQLALGQPRREHLEKYHRWENDPGTVLGYGNQWPQAREVREGGWGGQRANHNFPQFEVIRLDDMAPVGVTTLQVNTFARTAEFVIVLAPEERGKGYATEATRLTLDWAFHLGALRMVHLKVLEPNIAGIKAYERAGFQQAGRLRESGYWLGQVCDEVLMDALVQDFTGSSAVRALLGRG
ncbi:GNAT family N-acetyltransferase [Streptomyces sp. 130]|uniref:GNAT family N-acetyltransferase n=1 Tax=Streptomyces sp. 130 TaxID=2591006 RepID=UPI00117F8C30|nr:GNAT family protein [Streptomyces sp. 130]TRV75608.1 GNAT family N-acetyltransferase [Streptomyces sp. 130]